MTARFRGHKMSVSGSIACSPQATSARSAEYSEDLIWIWFLDLGEFAFERVDFVFQQIEIRECPD
jgi:hypothetical protein